MKKLTANITFKPMGVIKDQYDLVQSMIWGNWYKHLTEEKNRGEIENFFMANEDGIINLEIFSNDNDRLLTWKNNFNKLNKKFSATGRLFKLLKITVETKLEDVEDNPQDQNPNHSEGHG